MSVSINLVRPWLAGSVKFRQEEQILYLEDDTLSCFTLIKQEQNNETWPDFNLFRLGWNPADGGIYC